MFKLVYICFLFLQYYTFSKEFVNHFYFIEKYPYKISYK